MTPTIDKAIKALEPFGSSELIARAEAENDEGRCNYGVACCVRYMTTLGALYDARQALSDLSSLKLEDGDVEKAARIIDPDIWATRDYLASLNEPIMAHVDLACEPSRSKARAILSALGHGGEG